MAEQSAEKMNTTLWARLPKKVEETPTKNQQTLEPVPVQEEAQQVDETVKPREINWDVIGFSSAAVTLAGAGLLFMLGWAYEVNWYGYFGVSMSQVNSLPQSVIIQSVPSLVTLFTAFMIAIFIALFSESFFAVVELVWTAFKNRKKGGEQIAFTKLSDKIRVQEFTSSLSRMKI